MLTMTPEAGTYLSGILEERKCPEDVAIRFLCEDQGIAMRLDNVQPGDASIEHDGRTVLLLDEQVATMLDEQTLDLEKGEERERLFLAKE
jgi:Fe-S cluster assembly iron-binding protein IscA